MGPCFAKPNLQNPKKVQQRNSLNAASQKNSKSTADELRSPQMLELEFKGIENVKQNVYNQTICINKRERKKKEDFSRKILSDPTTKRSNYNSNTVMEQTRKEPLNNSQILINLDQEEQKVQTKCMQNDKKQNLTLKQQFQNIKSIEQKVRKLQNQFASKTTRMDNFLSKGEKKSLKEFTSDNLELRETFVPIKNSKQSTIIATQYQKSLPLIIKDSNSSSSTFYQSSTTSRMNATPKQSQKIYKEIVIEPYKIENEKQRNALIDNNQIIIKMKRYQAGLSVISEASGKDQKTNPMCNSQIFSSMEIRRSGNKNQDKANREELRRSIPGSSRFGPKLQQKSGQPSIFAYSD